MANQFTVNTYSAKDVTLIIGGYQVMGWENISISRNATTFTPIRGIRGKHTRIPSADTSATISVPILQTSASNDVFSAIHEADQINGTGRLQLLLKDGSGKSVFSSVDAYIVGFPVTTFSGGFEYRAWQIFCQSTQDFTVAGNARPNTNIFDSLLGGISNML